MLVGVREVGVCRRDYNAGVRGMQDQLLCLAAGKNYNPTEL